MNGKFPPTIQCPNTSKEQYKFSLISTIILAVLLCLFIISIGIDVKYAVIPNQPFIYQTECNITGCTVTNTTCIREIDKFHSYEYPCYSVDVSYIFFNISESLTYNPNENYPDTCETYSVNNISKCWFLWP